jgi:hypothetical protein
MSETMICITEYNGELTTCNAMVSVPIWEWCLRPDGSYDNAALVVHAPEGIQLTPRNWFLA